MRDVLVNSSPTGSHDYLRCPEVVQDFARCCQSMYGVYLEARFVSASAGCIVRFRGHVESPSWAATVACWYIWSTLRDEDLVHATWGPSVRGPIPPADILDVEVVS